MSTEKELKKHIKYLKKLQRKVKEKISPLSPTKSGKAEIIRGVVKKTLEDKIDFFKPIS